MVSRVFAKLAVLVVLAACGGGSTPTATTGGGGGGGGTVADQVTATSGTAFSPSTLNTNVGHTVTWVFQSQGHNVQFGAVAGVPANINGSNANTSIGRLFTAAGTFPYSCGIHPGMNGSIVVAP